jgi:hypothetical protein
MNTAVRATRVATPRSTLKLHRPPEEITSTARWLINGFPATISVWTAEEWARLSERPSDAQPFPNGSWCALRME